MASLKRLLYIFIPVLAILLMSHNAGAINTTFNLNNYEPVISGYYTQSCIYNDTTLNNSQNWACYLSRTDKNLRRIETDDKFSMKLGDIITFDVVIASSGSFSVISDFTGQQTEYPGFRLISLDIIDGDYQNVYAQNALIPTGYTIRKIYRYTYRVEVDNYVHAIGVGQNYIDNFSFALADGSTSLSGFNLSFSLRNVVVWRYAGSEENKEQSEATQDAADEASSSGSSSAADAETATSSLISVIGGFVNVLTTATPTNCKINANLNHIDMGQLDLCANPVPSYIQIIGSIILICAAIPLAIVLFNRFIGLFRSFQG